MQAVHAPLHAPLLPLVGGRSFGRYSSAFHGEKKSREAVWTAAVISYLEAGSEEYDRYGRGGGRRKGFQEAGRDAPGIFDRPKPGQPSATPDGSFAQGQLWSAVPFFETKTFYELIVAPLVSRPALEPS